MTRPELFLLRSLSGSGDTCVPSDDGAAGVQICSMSEGRPNPAGASGYAPDREGSEPAVDIYSLSLFTEGDARDEEQAEYKQGQAGVKGRVSMYVEIVNTMIDTVLLKEAYLFSRHELAVLQRFRGLSYEPKYLLTRLLLRKTNKIFSYTELDTKYSAEIGRHLRSALDELSTPLNIPAGGLDLPEAMDLRAPDIGKAEASFFTAAELEQLSHTPVTTPGEEKSSGLDAAGASVNVGDVDKPLPALKDIPTGLESDEEKKDPELARIIRKSALEAMKEAKRQARAVKVEDDDSDIEIIESPQAGRSRLSRQSDSPAPTKPLRSFPFGTPLRTDVKPDLKGKGRARYNPLDDVADEEAFYRMKEGSTEDITAFARSHTEMAVEEMIRYLTMAELSVIAKELKCWKAKYTRREVITALLNSANNQSRLFFSPISSPSEKSFARGRTNSMPPTPGSRQSTLSFMPAAAAAGPSTPKPARTFSTPIKTPGTLTKSVSMAGKSILYSKIVHQLGDRAIQVAMPLRLLISRVNLVYYRTTITPSSGVAKSLMLPEILTSSSKRAYPSEIQAERTIVWPTRDSLLEYERALEMEAIVDEALGEQNHSSGAWIGPKGYGYGSSGGRIEGARRVRKVWVGIWDKWKAAAAAAKGTGKQHGSRHVLDRFRLGHILTRVVSKGAVALGVLHEYDLECEVLRSLLAQRVWRRGKRGAWYDRLALVLMHHYGGDLDKKREAVETVIQGLEDDDTHLIYRPRLEKRLTRLEKQLDLPANERHICEAVLRKSEPRTLTARRVHGSAKAKAGLKRSAEEDEDGAAPAGRGFGGAKTWWEGREEDVGVEQWVLEWWEDKGYKGHHSESTILTTLFGILLWPILYTNIPGAFETPYQLAPLDLGDDSFYHSRKDAIEERLEKIEKTKTALEMLREVDERERPRGTMAIGVRWDFPRVDLEEIVKCLGGKSLSIICRMFCEEYGQRASGVPDLIVWHPKTLDCRFVEVKSPNDKLSETQKIWISVLLSADIDVEVCHVAEDNSERPPAAKKRKTGKGSRRRDQGEWSGGSGKDEDTAAEEEDEYDQESGEDRKGTGGQGRLVSRREAEAEEAEDKENLRPSPIQRKFPKRTSQGKPSQAVSKRRATATKSNKDSDLILRESQAWLVAGRTAADAIEL